MHKPIHKFVTDIVEELTKGYELFPKYHTIQKIIIPVVSTSSSDAEETIEPRLQKTDSEVFEKEKRQSER